MAAKLSNRDWWLKRIGILTEKADQVKHIDPDEVYPKNGFWPVIKLAFSQFALGFYGPIMRKQRESGAWHRLHFIDLCSGSGLTRLIAKNERGSVTVLGTALIGAFDPLFDHYHFVEPHRKIAAALEKRLAAILPEGTFTVHRKKRSHAVEDIAASIRDENGSAHFLAFVDPEGFTEITLPDLQPLLDLGRGDFLFNFQYMNAHRAPEQASAFLGSRDWESLPESELTAFFLKRLAELGRPRSVVVNVVAGQGSGRYAYDIVYAAAKTYTGNPWMESLRKDIDRRLEGVDGATLEKWVLGGQQTLF